MLIHVRTILNCEEQLQQEAAQINGLEKGTVVIGTFSIVQELILNKVRCNVNVYPIVPNEFRTIGLVTYKKQLLSPPTHS